MDCQLCGYEFDATNMACHAGCPLGKHCNLICCPNCGYQVVNEEKSTLASFIRRLWPSAEDAPTTPTTDAPYTESQPAGRLDTGEVPLTHIPIGRSVEIRRFREMPPQRQSRLSVYGLAAGSTVQVLQRRPAPVVRIGETELALSEEILGQIWVRPHPG